MLVERISVSLLVAFAYGVLVGQWFMIREKSYCSLAGVSDRHSVWHIAVREVQELLTKFLVGFIQNMIYYV